MCIINTRQETTVGNETKQMQILRLHQNGFKYYHMLCLRRRKDTKKNEDLFKSKQGILGYVIGFIIKRLSAR